MPLDANALGMQQLFSLANLLRPVADKFNPLAEQMNPLTSTEGARGRSSGYEGSGRIQSPHDGPLFHGSPTLRPGMKIDVERSSISPRTDKGYLGKAFYMTPQKWIAEAYAQPPRGGGGQRGSVLEAQVRHGRFLDVKYDENYIRNLEAAAHRLGVSDKFGSSTWADNFAKAAQKAGYIGARGLNSDGSVAEVAIYNPANILGLK